MGEGIARKLVQAVRSLISRALVVALCLPLAVGCYALWDSHLVYERADVDQWRPYKPTEPEPLSFWELQRINPEVQAWLSVYGTNIDYPVCQAADKNQDKYLNTDAKGEYSLSGALFIEVSNKANFTDFDTIIYGHHMESDVMFGPLTDFSEKAFFDEHRYGNLFVEDRNQGIEFFCYLDADAYDRDVYRVVPEDEPERAAYVELLRERARWWRDGVSVGPSDRIVLLSTCAAGYTNARAILVGKLYDHRFKDPFTKIPNFGTGVDEQEGWLGIPWWCWLVLALFLVAVVVLIVVRNGRRRAQ